MEKKNSRRNSNKKKRCEGIEQYSKSKKFLIYHDKKWCKPEHDDTELFASLILECFEDGLKWILIFEKEESFREAFDNFDIDIISEYNEDKIEELIQNKNIIRNKKKIEATFNNANKFLKIKKEFGSFDKYIWGFTNQKLVYHHLKIFHQKMNYQIKLVKI